MKAWFRSPFAPSSQEIDQASTAPTHAQSLKCKLDVIPEMTFKGHAMAMAFFVRSPVFTIRKRKSRLHLFSDKQAEMTLKVDQGHGLWSLDAKNNKKLIIR